MFGVQSLCTLLGGNSHLEENLNDKDILIRAKDRGGLCTVTPEVFKICLHVESKYRSATQIIQRNIDSKKIVSDPTVLCNYNIIRHQSAENL